MLCAMAQGRPDIPTALKRAVLVEAGHRCAITTCRQVPVDLAHITPWVKVKEHTFDNLIALCPTCHARYDRGEIDRKSMVQYKLNLEVLNGRYTDVERQLLKVCSRRWDAFRENLPAGISLSAFAEGRKVSLGGISIHEEMDWLLSNLIDDGIIEIEKVDLDRYDEAGRQLISALEPSRDQRVDRIYLTEKGCELLERLVAAEPI